MSNPFYQCANSEELEAKLAFEFWHLTLQELFKYAEDNNLSINKEKATYYFNEMETYASKDGY